MSDEAPQPAPEKRRTAQKKMTPDDKARLLELLKRPDVRVDGNIDIPSVCRISGLSYQTVYGFMRSDRYLHAQVAEVNPGIVVPSEVDIVDVEKASGPAGITITDAQLREYQAMLRQNRKMLARDWEALGMTEEAGKRMEHYVTLGTAPTGMILRATTGQLVSNLEILDRIVKADAERVLNGALPKELDGKGEPRDPELVEREWRHTVYTGMELQLKMFAHVHKVQALMARVMRDLQAMNGVGNKPDKGAYDREAQTVK